MNATGKELLTRWQAVRERRRQPAPDGTTPPPSGATTPSEAQTGGVR